MTKARKAVASQDEIRRLIDTCGFEPAMEVGPLDERPCGIIPIKSRDRLSWPVNLPIKLLGYIRGRRAHA